MESGMATLNGLDTPEASIRAVTCACSSGDTKDGMRPPCRGTESKDNKLTSQPPLAFPLRYLKPHDQQNGATAGSLPTEKPPVMKSIT